MAQSRLNLNMLLSESNRSHRQISSTRRHSTPLTYSLAKRLQDEDGTQHGALESQSTEAAAY